MSEVSDAFPFSGQGSLETLLFEWCASFRSYRCCSADLITFNGSSFYEKRNRIIEITSVFEYVYLLHKGLIFIMSIRYFIGRFSFLFCVLTFVSQ